MELQHSRFTNPLIAQLNQRVLMAPGPAEVYPEVLQALGAQAGSSDDPTFMELESQIKGLLQEVFRTRNEHTYVISGSGTIAMEATLFNVLQPGDEIIVGDNGIFGSRMKEISRRRGATPIAIETPWGQPIDPARVEALLKKHPRVKAVIVVHAETSTGALTNVQALGQLVQNYEALFIVDAHTSLGGVPLEVDGWGIDICYSGSQKCLSAPSGMAPITLSPRAVQIINQNKSTCPSWFADLDNAFDTTGPGPQRKFHHTPPSNLLYGLFTALNMLKAEGWQQVIDRHARNAHQLREGLKALGMELLVPNHCYVPQIHLVKPFEGMDSGQMCARLLQEHNLVVGNTIGKLRGQYVRIGLVGYGSRPEKVNYLLNAFEDIAKKTALLTTA